VKVKTLLTFGLLLTSSGDICPPGAALWGRQIEVGMLGTNYEMSNAIECQ